MNELSLFSGIGGGLLATHHLLGWHTIGYVENDDYCQQVLRARIADGLLSRAPIFTDVREFLQSGAAREYRGFADVVTAGFPCQPFSQAGKRRHAEDERNLWPATAEVIREVRPRHVFLENVVGIKRYLPVVLSDLRGMGYCVPRRAVVAAASVGAGHIRKRVWILAHRECQGSQKREGQRGDSRQEFQAFERSDGQGELFAHFDPQGQLQQEGLDEQERRRREGRQVAPELARSGWWANEPDVARLVHGTPHRMVRTRALGNCQVPAVAQAAWLLLQDLDRALTTP